MSDLENVEKQGAIEPKHHQTLASSEVSFSSHNGEWVGEPVCPAGINEKALVRKIDLRLIPMLFIIYVCAFLDRVNISNALTMSLPKDLKIVGVQRNIALTIFFVPYIIFEIPSNVLMKKFRPHIWLSGCILAFGIIMLCQGFVKTYHGLLATRFFLGLAEAGIFPGSFYLISIWYKREESQKRFTLYWCSVLIASGFGSLLASAIAKMDGLRGLHNWQWIFILEGILTVCVGLVAFFFVSDFPEEVSWLTEEEKTFVIARARGGHSQAADQRIGTRDVLTFFKDPKNFLGGLMYLTLVTPVYSFAYFTPTIIKTYGYSTIGTQLHTTPPFIAALGLCLLCAYLSDRFDIRAPFVALGCALMITGLAILMTVHKKLHVEYFAIFLVSMGMFVSGIAIVCWYVMNLRGHAARAIGTAWMIGFGNCGGIIATFAFQTSDAPLYHTGFSICMAAAVICAASSTIYGILIWRENQALKAKHGADKSIQYYGM